MKTITIEIPDNADEAGARLAVQRAVDPDWIAVWWNTEDVLSVDGDEESDLTEEECREILRLADRYHDAENGINWSVLGYWIDQVKSKRGE